MPKTILQRDHIDQEAALLLLKACLREPAAPRYLRRLLDHPEMQAWLLGRKLDTDHDEGMAWETHRNVFHDLLHELEQRRGARPFYPDTVAFVGERFGLSEAERGLVWLAVLHDASLALRNALGEIEIDVSRRRDAARVLSHLLNLPVQDVAQAIGEGGSLIELGLLQAPMAFHRFDDYLQIGYTVASALRDGSASDGLLQLFLHPARTTALGADDFPHLSDDFRHVTHYLQAALQARTCGVNVLLYGSPGTGKTEFASVIAQHLGVPMFAVPDEFDPRYVSDAQSRLVAYRAAQRLLASTPALILFDDLEDGVLNWEAGMFTKRTSGKSALNNMLDANPVPAIWITNSAELMEPAHLRRFDYAIAFKAPPRSVRATLVDKGLHGLPVSADLKASLADDRLLTPAQLSKIAKVVGHASSQAGTDDGQDRLDGLARNVYLATRKLRFRRHDADLAARPTALEFDPAFINASLPVKQIVEAFRNAPGLTGCFHGLPGSGKTALAEYVAWSLDKPLLVKRGSDLLRPYLGETELRLKGMFEEAMDEDALLLLDEADSFLTDRERAQRSWEVTQVNELLTQIERYRGHFIATTNAFDVLDPASLRRFDLKVRFDPLRPEQRLRLLETLLRSLGLASEATECDVQAVLDGLGQLTPGDYTVVARRLASSMHDVDAATVIDALREEHQLKRPVGRPAGFVH